MREATVAMGLLVAGLLAGCADGGMTVGGPPPDDLETEMLSADPMQPGAIDDATGTQIP